MTDEMWAALLAGRWGLDWAQHWVWHWVVQKAVLKADYWDEYLAQHSAGQTEHWKAGLMALQWECKRAVYWADHSAERKAESSEQL